MHYGGVGRCGEVWGGVGRCGEVGGGKVNPVNAGLTGRLGLPKPPPGRPGRTGGLQEDRESGGVRPSVGAWYGPPVTGQGAGPALMVESE